MICMPWRIWWNRWRLVVGSREETELALLALLGWQDRTDRWMRFPEAGRAAPVTELARLMTRVATEGSDDERQGEDQRPSP